jgi:hypothetical protein
VIYPPLD